MAETINLNDIVNSVVEYEINEGRLSNVIPQNLGDISSFTNNNNTVFIDNDFGKNIVLNGYKIKIVNDKSGLEKYFPEYYSQVSADIDDDLSFDDEAFDEKLNLIRSEISAALEYFRSRESILSDETETSVTNETAGLAFSSKLLKRDSEDVIHGVRAEAFDEEDKCSEWRLDRYNFMKSQFNDSNWGNGYDLTDALYLDDCLDEAEARHYKHSDYTKVERLFDKLLKLYNKALVKDNLEREWIWDGILGGTVPDKLFTICASEIDTDKKSLKSFSKNIDKLLKLLHKSRTDFEKEYERLGGIGGDLCDTDVKKIQKAIDLFYDIADSIAEIDDANIDRNTAERVLERVEPGTNPFAIKRLAATAFHCILCQYVASVRADAFKTIDDIIIQHSHLNHDQSDVMLVIKGNFNGTEQKTEICIHPPFEYDEIASYIGDKLESFIKYNSYGGAPDGKFLVGVEKAIFDKISDRIGDLLDLQSYYDNYIEHGDNKYAKKIKKYDIMLYLNKERPCLDDVRTNAVYCNANRSITTTKYGEFGQNYDDVEELQTASKAAKIELKNVRVVADLSAHTFDIYDQLTLKYLGELSKGFSNKDDGEYESYADKNIVSFCGVIGEIQSGSYSSKDLDKGFCLLDDRTLGSISDEEAPYEADNLYTINTDNSDLPVTANVFYKIREVCELDTTSSEKHPRMSCDLSGWIETISCDNCGETYKQCTQHNITEPHSCRVYGENCSKNSEWYGQEENAPLSTEICNCHHKNMEIVSSLTEDELPPGIWIENGLIKYRTIRHTAYYCNRAEGECLNEDAHRLNGEWDDHVYLTTGIGGETIHSACPYHDGIPSLPIETYDPNLSAYISHDEDTAPASIEEEYGHGPVTFVPVDVNVFE